MALLKAGGKGGNRAVLDLEHDAPGTFSLRYQHSGEFNEWSIVDEVITGGIDTPCAIQIPVPVPHDPRDLQPQLERLADCDEIHLYAGGLWSHSDWYSVPEILAAVLGSRILVVHGVSSMPHIRRLVAMHFANSRFPD